MRLVFAGTPEFAERALARLVAAGHEIALVLTQPDRPAGRGLKHVVSPVARFAAARGFAIAKPGTLNSAPEVERVCALRPDALVVAAYGLLLPRELLNAAGHGALNIHASLLPRWRGAAPIQRALLAGDSETGISIMQMDVGLDTGPVVMQKRIPILPDDDAGTLHDKLAVLGGAAMVEALNDIEAGRARAVVQAEEGVTYAAKIHKRDTHLDWSRPARELERAVRAFRPAPGAFGMLDGEVIKIWRAQVVDIEEKIGAVKISNERVVVACGEQGLAISELQRAGGRRLTAEQFLRGRSVPPGARFQ